jgi:hypothetical protein
MSLLKIKKFTVKDKKMNLKYKKKTQNQALIKKLNKF